MPPKSRKTADEDDAAAAETGSVKRLTVKECIGEYRQTCDQIRELERYKDVLHDKLVGYMQEKGQTSVSNDQYTAKLAEFKRETVSRKNLPPDVWDRYKQTLTYPRLTIVKKR